MSGGGRARASRLAIAAQVALASLLALALAVLATWTAARPGLRARLDLTADRQNTLAPSSATVLAGLPREVAVDVFFRPADPPLREVAQEVHARTRRLLVLARAAAGARLSVEDHDLAGASGGASRAETRLRELGLRELEPGGLVVVSSGARTHVLRLRGDLADLDPGDPQGRFGPPRPPRLVSWRGEEALVGALLKVAQDDRPKVVFSSGHGELDTAKPDIGGLALLAGELERDGFAVETWDGERTPRIPEDALVLALVGPEQPFTAAERAEIEAFVASGGRLVAASGYEPRPGEGTLVELLAAYGIRIVVDGVVARPLVTATGQAYVGDARCSDLVISRALISPHPLTDPLRRGDRRIALSVARALERGEAPRGGVLLDLFRSPDESWRDLAPGGNPLAHDWRPGPGEPLGPFVLGLATVFPAPRPAPEARASVAAARPESRPESRIVAIGAASAFANENFATNRDLLLNAFNWAAAREFRVGARAKDPVVRRIDVTSGRALPTVHLVSVFLLPGACLALGVWTAWRRRR